MKSDMLRETDIITLAEQRQQVEPMKIFINLILYLIAIEVIVKEVILGSPPLLSIFTIQQYFFL